MMKKYILLTVSMILTAVASFAANGDRFQSQGIWYEVIDEVAKTCKTAGVANSADLEFYPEREDQWSSFYGVKDKSGQSKTYNLGAPNKDAVQNLSKFVVPSTAVWNKDGKQVSYTVVEIGDFSFAGQVSVGELVIPDSVKKIGKGAFYLWQNLKKLDLGQGVEVIGEGAFCQTAPDHLVIPGSVEKIESKAFMGCNAMNSVTFSEGLKSIGDDAFRGCSAIKGYLTFPDSLEEIGDNAFYLAGSISGLYFGSNLRKVGKEAFYRINMDPQRSWILPPSLTEIGENAFNTANKVSTFTDIYYANMNPDDVDDNAFGFIEGIGEVRTFDENYWMYATVCLHVPYGTADLYRKLKGWRNFKCIIDDLLPVDPSEGEKKEVDPLSYILDYIYLVPGDDPVNLTEMLGEDKDAFIWDEIKSGDKFDIVSLDAKGNLQPKSYGNVVALARRSNIGKLDSNGNPVKVDDAVVGAVVIFVCPTITVVYDKDGLTDSDAVTGGTAPAGLNDQYSNDATYLQSSNTTYSHPVVYNSFPKVQVNPSGQIVIQTLERASLDANNDYIEDLSEVKNDNWDKTGAEGYVGAVLPDHPVTEDRMIVVNLAVPYGISTDNTPIEIDHKVSVITSKRNLRIVGADASSEVRVINLQGQTVYRGLEKDIDLDPGVYVITVEEATFKALVK